VAKLGDQPTAGRYQAPARSSEVQRVAQATEVNAFVKQIQAVNPLANIVVLGDLNDFQFSSSLKALTAGHALLDLMNTLPADERYSYVYQGNSQAIDHILASPSIIWRDYQVVHINSEFADQASDHEPQVLRFVPLFR
jgi:predicted extracellular nuclease